MLQEVVQTNAELKQEANNSKSKSLSVFIWIPHIFQHLSGSQLSDSMKTQHVLPVRLNTMSSSFLSLFSSQERGRVCLCVGGLGGAAKLESHQRHCGKRLVLLYDLRKTVAVGRT